LIQNSSSFNSKGFKPKTGDKRKLTAAWCSSSGIRGGEKESWLSGEEEQKQSCARESITRRQAINELG